MAELNWSSGRSAVEQVALMREHSSCTHCLNERRIVVAWENGDAVWGPCPACAWEASGER